MHDQNYVKSAASIGFRTRPRQTNTNSHSHIQTCSVDKHDVDIVLLRMLHSLRVNSDRSFGKTDENKSLEFKNRVLQGLRTAWATCEGYLQYPLS